MKRAILAHFVLAVGLGLTSLLLFVLGNPSPSLPVVHAAELHVCPSGCSYSSIQAAVDAASDGDIIKVATGVYTGINTYGSSMQIVYISKTVTIQGGYTTTDWTTPYPITQPTTLDAQGYGRVLYIIGDISPTIEGLGLTGGHADLGGSLYIYDAAGALHGNRVFSNVADLDGGGLFLYRSAAIVSGNTFVSNRAGQNGGGVYLWDSRATLMGNRAVSNTASDSGGGLYLWYGINQVISNTISDNRAEGEGGGVYLDHSTHTIDTNTLGSNTAWLGGGIFADNMTGTLSGNMMISNSASLDGGGIFLYRTSAAVSGNTFISNHASQNGGGMYLWDSQAKLTGNSAVSNTASDSGGGLYLWYGVNQVIGNAISANKAENRGGGVFLDHSTHTINANLIFSNTAQYGGGLYSLSLLPTAISNTVLADNQAHIGGDGWYVDNCTLDLPHTTIARNKNGQGSGIAVANGSTVVMTNTILVSQTIGITTAAGSTVIANDILWFGNGANTGGDGSITITHEITGDPAFAPDGYHLTAASAAIDQGVDAGVTIDIDGQVRPLGLAPDLGADEFASIRYIATSGVDVGDCSNSAAPCRTVQYAVDVADEGNTIKVATGVYTDVQARPRNDLWVEGVVTQVVYISRPLTIQGGYTTSNWTMPHPITQPTTLDAQGQGRVLYITRYATPLTIAGLDITGGNAAGLGGSGGPSDAGGGVYASYDVSVTLSNNRIFSNTTPGDGGGLYVRGGLFGLGESYTTLDNNTIMSNVARSASGAYIEFSYTTWNNNRVISNTAQVQPSTAADMFCSPATLNGNTIAYNRSNGLTCYCPDGALGMLSNNVIHGNTGFGLNLSGNAIVKENIISSNNGGLSVYGNIIIEANTIISNTVGPYVFGGGVQGGGYITLTANTIASNTAWVGGGAFLDTGITTLYSNTFRANSANYGGGLAVYNTASLHGDLFISNTAIGGGGLVLNDGNVTLDRVKIISNTTSQYGGGIGLFSGQATIVNTVLTGNRANEFGSGLFIRHANAQILHSTIAHNSEGDGVGIHVYSETISTVLVTNTILANHTAGITVTAGGTATLNGVLWYGNGANTGGDGFITVTHEITGDPAFAPDGYHLTAASAAIDQGVDAGVTTDIDGDLRPASTGFDLGADEFPAALIVTKQVDPNPVQAGAQLTYTLRVTNTGNVDLHVTITDILPPYLDSGQTSGGTALLPGQPYTWTAILSSGSVWTETIVANVMPGYSGTLTNAVQVTTAEGATGIYTATSQVQVTPMLKVTKQANSDVVQAGSQLTYTLRITNTGNVDLHATITDTLPAHVMPGGVLTWTPTITAPDGVWLQAVVVNVELGYTGTLTNHVQVTTLEGITGETSSVVNVIGYRVYLPLVLR